MKRWIALAAAVGLSCTSVAPTEGPWVPEGAHAGVEDGELAQLLDEHWAWVLERNPAFATRIGVRRFDDRLADRSHEAVVAARAERDRFAQRGRDIARRRSLSPSDATTLDILIGLLERDAATDVCETHLWSVDPHLGNALNFVHDLPVLHGTLTEQDGANLLQRYRAVPRALEERTANLRRGLELGYVANAAAVELMASQIEQAVAEGHGPLLTPIDDGAEGWTPEARGAFETARREVVTGEIQPAFERYAAFLRTEVLPRARDASNEGITGIPNGAACYAARITQMTTLVASGPGATSARELHQLGLNEISWLNAEMLEIGEAELGETETAALMWRLRLDPGLHFDRGETIVAGADAALAAARAAIPEWFGTLPQADCEVVPVPEYRAAASPAAYYSMSGAGEDRVGRFYVNTHEPSTRPRFALESLTFHESIPGHHLQIALQQELGEIPAFRRYFVSVAFTEGWGLYAERLAGEMGLYTGPLDHLGALGNEAWRAARLVVDTGVHALGWTREDAVEFLLGYTPLDEHDARTEVGRYISNPGQALAYKIGQLELLALRKRARDELGDRFDIRAFHDVVLLGGAVPLPTLRDRVEQWLETQRD